MDERRTGRKDVVHAGYPMGITLGEVLEEGIDA
jgi:hypothetical protein